MRGCIPEKILNDFWNAIPLAQKVSKITVLGSEHKMPEAVPGFSALWIDFVLRNRQLVALEKVFVGDPKFNIVKTESGQQIPLAHSPH